MDSERLEAIVEEAKEYGHWDIVKRVSGNYTLFDGGRAVAEFGEAVYDARFILDAIRALPQLNQRVQTLEAENATLRGVDIVNVWEHIKEYGGTLNENGTVLYSPNTIATRIDLIHNGDDWLSVAAEWVRQYKPDIECDECDGKGVKPAAYWSDDGTGEDCWKCKGEGKLHGQSGD